MEVFKADIIEPNKKGKIIFYSLAGLVLLIFAVLIFLQVIPVVLQFFSVTIWLFALARYFLQSKKQILKKTVGQLQITEDQVELHDQQFQLEAITSIKIFVSGWKNYNRSPDRQQPISNLHNGDKNFITLEVSGKVFKVEFLLTSQMHWEELRQQVMNWHRKQVKLIEENEAGKTYGLRQLNYKEIQEFKDQLRNSKMIAS